MTFQDVAATSRPLMCEMFSFGLLILSLLAGVATAQSVGGGTCPERYTLIGSICFFVSPKADLEARRAPFFCENHDGTLATVKSFEEILLLRQSALIGSTTYLINYDINGFAMDQRYRNYAKIGFPIQLSERDCVVLDGTSGLRWRKVDCLTKHTVLCEAAASQPSATLTSEPKLQTVATAQPVGEETCPERYVLIGSKCYFMSPKSDLEARRAPFFCSNYDGTLATIESFEEIQLLRQTAFNGGTTYLINYNIDGFARDQRYRNYAKIGFPIQLSERDCVVLDGTSGLRWRKVNCLTKHTVLCEAAASQPAAKMTSEPKLQTVATTQPEGEATCPKRYTLLGSECYFMSPSADTRSRNAHIYCSIQHGTLATIRSYEEILLLRESSLLGSTKYLINFDITGFARGQAYRESAGMGFDLAAPIPSKLTQQDCVVVDGAASLRWEKVDCVTSRHAVLCKTPAQASPVTVATAPTTTTPTTPATTRTTTRATTRATRRATTRASTSGLPSCSPGAHMMGNVCFRVSEQKRTFPKAESYCREHGMELSSVHSQEENDFLLGLLGKGNRLWLPLGYSTRKGVFEWADGTPLDYVNWDSPRRGGSVDCVVMWDDGTWDDDWCDDPLSTRAACRAPAA